MIKIGVEKKLLYNGATIISGDAYDTTLLIPAAGGGISLPLVAGFPERYLTFYAETMEDHSLALELWARTDEVKQKGSVLAGCAVRFGIMPQFRTLICLDTKWFDGHILFPGHTEGELKVVYHGGRLNPEQAKNVTLEVRSCFHDVRLHLSDIRLTNERPESFPIPDGKLIDELGQYKKKTWPGKVKDIEELKNKLNNLLAGPDNYPKDWTKYGGWIEKKLAQGTGFFSKAKIDGRWWLVDPEGYAFFSTGPDCVNVSSDCRVDGVEKLLDWLPSQDDPDYKGMFRITNRHNSFDEICRPNGIGFSYAGANLFRVFGKDWYEKWCGIIPRLLKPNGMNTIANWSDANILGKIPVPYVLPLRRFPGTKHNIFRDFPDVLSDEYRKDAKECAAHLLPFAKDPYMIGYFLRNEPNWAFVNDLIIADEVLYDSESSTCKNELIKFLADRYVTPNALSKAWNHAFDSFDDLRKSIPNASKLSKASMDDMREFSRLLLKAYVTIPTEACREVDPNHMNLGMRWAWISDPDLVTGWENFDVFSINCYSDDPTSALDNVRNLGVDLPILIGEFHFGALDMGPTATGLKGTPNQRERGKAYRYYCERVAAHPFGVGCHWFQLYDQFPLGRFDGENYNIGLLDICSMPNEEMMSAIRNCAKSIYQVADGTVQPAKDKAEFIPMIAF